ncbi:MAG: type II secretion system F family protein [Thermoflexales bacterium]|nr:type II secretion system F family protein [Thermoflexales bacterium]
MDTGTLIQFITISAALTAGALGYVFTGNMAIGRGHYAQRLSRVFGAAEEGNTWQKIGGYATQSPVGRFLPIEKVESDLPWAHLIGKWASWQAGEIIGLSLVLGLVGIAVGFYMFRGGVMVLATGAFGFYAPILLMGSSASESRRTFRRQLPEMVQVVAAEVSAGASIETAISRLAESPTVVGMVFADMLARSRGKMMFSTEHQEGVLKQLAAAWRLPDLTSFVANLDQVQRAGIQGPEQLTAMAKIAANEYLGERERKAENLDNVLLMPMTLFFFVPFMVIVLGPVFLQLMAVL